MTASLLSTNTAWTKRQQDVLEAVLQVLAIDGDRMSMTAVARRASCSKETLYKWFGDRDGLLTATVQWQALRVRVAPIDPASLDLTTLRQRLEEFAANWLTVIATETSIALNRVAIAQAASAQGLGAIVLENGRFEMGRRLKPVLEAGRHAGLLAFDDAEMAFRIFFGLVARDIQIRLLLGDAIDSSIETIRADAAHAADYFLALFSVQAPPGTAGIYPPDSGKTGAHSHQSGNAGLYPPKSGKAGE